MRADLKEVLDLAERYFRVSVKREAQNLDGELGKQALRQAVYDLMESALEKTISNPPDGMKRVTNLYVDPATGKLVIKWDDS